MESVLPFPEAELFLSSFKHVPIEECGSAQWTTQHGMLERMNIQAHLNVQQQAHDYITEAFLNTNRVTDLVRDLIVTEVWKDKVFDQALNALESSQMSDFNDLKCYMILYHEVTVLNLLELMSYDKHVLLSVEPSAMIDLVDYLCRKIAHLLSDKLETARQSEDAAKEKSETQQLLEDVSTSNPVKTLRAQRAEMDFKLGIIALSLLRYVTDYITQVPLAVMHRLLIEQDMPAQCVQLLESSPWLRKEKGVLQIFEGSSWVPLSALEDGFSKVEAQLWLMLANLLCTQECAKMYEWTRRKQENMLKIDDMLNETLTERVPPLQMLKRFFFQLKIATCPEAPQLQTSKIREVAPLYEDLMARSESDWSALAQATLKRHLLQTSTERMKAAQQMAAMYNMDVLESLVDEDPSCAECGAPAAQRCSKCRSEWYCSRPCQVKAWKTHHKKLCTMLQQTNAPPSNMEQASRIIEVTEA